MACKFIRVGLLTRGLTLAVLLSTGFPAQADHLNYVESYFDGVNGVNGLDWVGTVETSPDGKHVYGVGALDRRVAVFSRDAITGVLTFVEAESVGSLLGTRTAISPDGRHLYLTGSYSSIGRVRVSSRDTTTGELTYIETVSNGSGGVQGIDMPGGVAVSPGGEHVYVTGQGDDAVALFSRDSGTGQLTFVEAKFDGVDGVDGLDGAGEVRLSPDGNQVYVTGVWDDALAVFDRDPSDGRLTQIQVLRDGIDGVDGLGRVTDVSFSPDGAFAYVAAGIPDWDGDQALSVFSRDAISGMLTFEQIRPHVTGQVDGLIDPRCPRVSPDGAYVYVNGWSQSAIAAYTRDPVTGLVTFLEGHQGGEGTGLWGARYLSISPDGGHVYVASRVDDALTLYNVAMCGDENLDPGEDCDDGNTADGDGCDATCTLAACYSCTGQPSVCTPEAIDTACPDDGDDCTDDVCDGAGTCTHPAGPADVPCPDDGDVCTDDVCDNAGTCTHPPGLAGVPCPDDGNVCTDDLCNDVGECIHTNNTVTCYDGLACTDSVCSAGVCFGPWEPAVCALDDFKLYKAKINKPAPQFEQVDVYLEDQFRTWRASAIKASYLGNPVDRDSGGTNVPEVHLLCYKTTKARTDTPQAKFVARRVQSSNAFGVEILDMTKPAELCLPTGKDFSWYEALPAHQEVDHFLCYKAKTAKEQPKFVQQTVSLLDQFEDKLTTVMKPARFCNPVDKNGEGIASPSDHLACYKIKDARIKPRQSKFMRRTVYTDNQFHRTKVTAIKPKLLCLRSTKLELN